MVRIAGSHPAGPGSIPGAGTQNFFGWYFPSHLDTVYVCWSFRSFCVVSPSDKLAIVNLELLSVTLFALTSYICNSTSCMGEIHTMFTDMGQFFH